jgi:hypothetical protein
MRQWDNLRLNVTEKDTRFRTLFIEDQFGSKSV